MNKLMGLSLGLTAALMTGCSSMPTMEQVSQSVTTGAKGVGNFLLELDKQAREMNGTSASTSSRSKGNGGVITLAQCKSSEGKTRTQISKLIGVELNESNAHLFNSFTTTYNIALKDMNSRMMPNTPAMCSLTFGGALPSSKVVAFSIISV